MPLSPPGSRRGRAARQPGQVGKAEREKRKPARAFAARTPWRCRRLAILQKTAYIPAWKSVGAALA